ncbi:MAG: hypothetical protein ABJA82_04470 [Myxococcales bacterium]
MIVVQQAAETLASKHQSVRVSRWRSSREQHIGKTLMVALAVIVDKVFSDGSPKVSFAERDNPIEAFALDGQYKTFRIGVPVSGPPIPGPEAYDSDKHSLVTLFGADVWEWLP